MDDEQNRLQAELTKFEQTIANLRELLSGEALDAALAPLLARQAEIEAMLRSSGAIAQMVQMLFIVCFSKRRLPDQRAELYMKATDASFIIWDQAYAS